MKIARKSTSPYRDWVTEKRKNTPPRRPYFGHVAFWVLPKANFSAPFSGLLSIYFRGSLWALLPTESADLSLFCFVLPFCFPFLLQVEKLPPLMRRNTPPTRTPPKVNFASSCVVAIIYGQLFALQVPDFRLFDSPSCLAPRFSSKGE